jgi:hypothetical protein
MVANPRALILERLQWRLFYDSGLPFSEQLRRFFVMHVCIVSRSDLTREGTVPSLQRELLSVASIASRLGFELANLSALYTALRTASVLFPLRDDRFSTIAATNLDVFFAGVSDLSRLGVLSVNRDEREAELKELFSIPGFSQILNLGLQVAICCCTEREAPPGSADVVSCALFLASCDNPQLFLRYLTVLNIPRIHIDDLSNTFFPLTIPNRLSLAYTSMNATIEFLRRNPHKGLPVERFVELLRSHLQGTKMINKEDTPMKCA